MQLLLFKKKNNCAISIRSLRSGKIWNKKRTKFLKNKHFQWFLTIILYFNRYFIYLFLNYTGLLTFTEERFSTCNEYSNYVYSKKIFRIFYNMGIKWFGFFNRFVIDFHNNKNKNFTKPRFKKNIQNLWS